MITPLKKHRGQHGALIALLMLAAATVVVLTAHPRRSKSSRTHAPVAAVSSGDVATTPPDQAPVAEQPKTVVVDDGSPVIAIGVTSYDETRTSHVRAPVHGWLKKTHAKSVGRTVRSGETLGIVYSPEVYLATASVVDQIRNYRDQASLDAERYRLLGWGMLQTTVSRIEKTLKPQFALPLLARVSGTVVAEAGLPAQFVEPSGFELFTITDPAYACVYVDVPEAYAARLAVGTSARITIEGIARPVTAEVAYVYRRAEEGMRKVRFDLHSSWPGIKPNLPVKAEFLPVVHRARP